MRILTAKDAKYDFGRLIDLARSAPVAVSQHGRGVVVVVAVEEFERLKALETPLPAGGHARPGMPSAHLTPINDLPRACSTQ